MNSQGFLFCSPKSLMRMANLNKNAFIFPPLGCSQPYVYKTKPRAFSQAQNMQILLECTFRTFVYVGYTQ